MKIAFFTDVLLPPDGGIEQHVLTTSQALAKAGNEVRVYYPGPFFRKVRSFDGLSFSVASIPMPFVWPNFRFSFPIYLYFELKKWKPAVLHFHTSGPMAWTAIILSKLLKIKLVGTFHSYLMEKEYLGSASWRIGKFREPLESLVSRFLWWYIKTVFNRCDVVVSPSAWVAGDIKDHGINRPVQVVHNGADLTEFGGGVDEKVTKLIRDKYNLGENVLLYVGRLSREKSLDILIKAIKGLTSYSLLLTTKLLLVGDGPAKGELEKLAGDLGILNNVVFVGRVNHQDLPGSGLFEVSKAFVTASASENQPLTIIEAMAKGLPIIGVSARGVTELVNENGLLAMPSDENDLSNKISQLLGDEGARIKMGEHSRKISQDYSLSKAARNLEKIYREVRSKD